MLGIKERRKMNNEGSKWKNGYCREEEEGEREKAEVGKGN